MTQYVYRFGGGVSDGDETVRGNKNVLGGKGANLDGMGLDWPASASRIHDYYRDVHGLLRQRTDLS
jgi:hypothetical protein